VARATEMRTAKAVVAATMEMASTMEMARTMTMAATMPSSVASAPLAERQAREQGRQNKHGNSNGWFGHGTLPAPLARRCGTTMTPMGTESSTPRLLGAPIR
jgi:hypothetical protein